jgi:hypothetical protein
MNSFFRRLDHPFGSSHLTGLLLAVVLGVAASGGRTTAASGKGETRGFLITGSSNAFHYGAMEVDCPQGFEPSVEELWLATLDPAERTRLKRPEHAKEYAQAWKDDYISGPGDENVCNNPKSFLTDPRHPPYLGVQSPVSYGLNLDGTTDGRATPNSCEHPKFAGLNGEPAVDNQLYRALGCVRVYDGDIRLKGGDTPAEQRTRRSLNLYLIELRGLDDLRNDDEVEVGIYSTDDLSLRSPSGTELPHQSFRVTSNPRWHTRTKGRLINGVLTTDVVEVLYLSWLIPTTGAFGQASEHEFHDVRFQLSLRPDGTLTGIMGAYRPIENITTEGRCCKSMASVANHDCASEHKTFVAMADGHPDPVTGMCTMLSAAQRVEGIPAFVIQ